MRHRQDPFREQKANPRLSLFEAFVFRATFDTGVNLNYLLRNPIQSKSTAKI